MPVGAPGKEQFRDAQVKMRNLALAGYIGQVLLLREEFLDNDEMAVRSGFDDATLDHLNQLLTNADRWRRRITHNPEGKDIKVLIEDSRDITKGLPDSSTNKRPGGDDIQRGSGGWFNLPFALDGTDPNIPLMSALSLRNATSLIVLGAIDRHIVSATRIEDRFSTYRITPSTSLMLFGGLQEIHVMINDFGGDKNRLHIAGGTRRTEEPRGFANAPNAVNESTGQGGVAGQA